jgi:FMN-binding domain
MRRAVIALLLTALAVVLLARYETTPPVTRSADDPAKPPAIETPSPAPPGSVSAVGPALITPFSAIQVKATLLDGELVGIETVAMSGDGPHTDALNARAEPILRERALRAGSADVDVVTGATSSSEIWLESLAGAIRKARRAD